MATTAAWSDGGVWRGVSVIEGSSVGGDDSHGGKVGRVDEPVRGEDVVDQFAVPAVDACCLWSAGGQQPVQVPQPPSVAIVTGVESGSWGEVDLGAAGALQQLGRGGVWFVVQVAAETRPQFPGRSRLHRLTSGRGR